MITAVDAALERLVRERLPLPESVGDVSFEVPDRNWGARRSRVTVNLFLFDVGRSERPALAPVLRTSEEGRLERRPALPMVRLSYLVTAWAGSLRDEHQLLGDVLTCLLTQQVLPPAYLPEDLPASAVLTLGQREGRKPGDIQGAFEGTLKPGIELDVTLAVDAAWEPAATPVTSVRTATSPPSVPPVPTRSPMEREAPATTRRRVSGGVVSERMKP